VRDEGEPDPDEHESKRRGPVQAAGERRHEADDGHQGEQVERGVHRAILLMG
jgi:hypothetical protein